MNRSVMRLLGVIILCVMLASCAAENDAKKNTSDNIAPSVEFDEADFTDANMIKADLADICDGEYDITAFSDSSMFNITECKLNIKAGKGTASITVDSPAYTYVAAGTPEDTVAADGSAYIRTDISGDSCTFTIDVDRLGEIMELAVYNDSKEMWYGRQIILGADMIPADAYSVLPYETAGSLGLEDGTYHIDVDMEGGSGRASIESPAKLIVKDGKATCLITWSSPYYDYMLVQGEKYLPVNSEGNSTFEIPVYAFDTCMAVTGDTTAMSKPHEIDYSFTFRSDSIREA